MAENPALRTPAQYGHLIKISDGDEVIEICLWNILLTFCIQNYVVTVFTWCSKQTLSTNTYSQCCERCSFCLVNILLVGVLLGILGGGMCYPVLQILTLFQTKKCHFSHLFSDLASKN